MRSFLHHLSTFGSCAVIFLSIAVHVQAQDTEAALNYSALSEAVEQLEQRLDRLRGEIDQTRFDAEELVFELAFDAESVIGFVRDEIAFHPYEGLLRGMRGTLMSRAGNSLDQSLLLAFMLESAGSSARIVRGELNDADIQRLLGSVAPVRTRENTLDELTDEIQTLFGGDAAAAPEPIDWAETDIGKDATQTVAMLQQRLTAASLTMNPDPVLAELQDATRPYFWVEHRMGPGDEWQAVHPAFAGLAEPEVEAQGYMASEVDEAFYHTITVEAWVRSRQGDTVSDHRLMAPWTRPVANLHGVTITYRNHAGSITPETLSNLDEALTENEILTPVFQNQPAPSAMAFDLKGQLIDPMVLGSGSSGAAGLFAQLSDRMQAATEGVDDREDGRSIFGLDAMWLTFTLTTPSGDETEYRRYLLAPGSDALPPAEKLWPLITEHVYVVNAGQMPIEYVAERYLAAGSESMELYAALAHHLIHPDQGTALPEQDVLQDFGPLSLYRLMEANPIPSDAIAVRTVPSIVGIRNGLRDHNRAFTAVDVVENRMLMLRNDQDGLRHDPVAALEQGVWDTAIEVVPARIRDEQDQQVLNTFEVFQQASQQGIDLTLLAPSDAVPASLPEGVAKVLQHDLDNGFAVLIPERRPDAVSMTAWWRIDPVTGTTLGMTADGYGQTVVEYLIEVTGIAFNLVQALAGMAACDKHTDTVVKMCCLVEAHINNVSGLAFGSIMGATVGSAGAAVFDIVNYGMQQATAAALGPENSQGLMPQTKLSCDKMAGRGF